MQRHTGRWISTFALLLSLFAAAQAAQTNGPPLDEASTKAVTQEIQAMIRTLEENVHAFVVREATPERIERLYKSPQLRQLPRNIRENGLIFAGHGTLLSFNKPSDVLDKLTAWFPAEFAAARAMTEPGFFTQLRLYGPYPTWDPEPAAFIALWKCMPQTAWIKPVANPSWP